MADPELRTYPAADLPEDSKLRQPRVPIILPPPHLQARALTPVGKDDAGSLATAATVFLGNNEPAEPEDTRRKRTPRKAYLEARDREQRRNDIAQRLKGRTFTATT